MLEKIGADALVIIPCCASKAAGGISNRGYSDPLKDFVPNDCLERTIEHRSLALRTLKNTPDLLAGKYEKNLNIEVGPDFGGQVSTGRYLQALHRYQGTLYSVPGLRHVIEESVSRKDAPQILILSALYGPLHPLSPIQDYNLMMSERPARIWDQAFPSFLEAWVAANKTKEIYLFVGTSTAYFRTARKAVMHLLARRLIEKAVQFHVVDGSTRETPFQHGRLLHALLTGTHLETDGIQINRLDSEQTSTRSESMLPPPSAHESVSLSSFQANSFSPSLASVLQPIFASNFAETSSNEFHAAVKRPINTALRPYHEPNLQGDIKHFLDLLRRLAETPMQGLSLSELVSLKGLSERGIYFFLDSPINDSRQEHWRVSRVGTHAISVGSKSTLRSRLMAHLGSRSGVGNHRGSIFRLHVGNAMLRQGGKNISTWGIGSVAPLSLRMSEDLQNAERALELQVSNYVGSLGVLWVDAPDEASPDSERAIIERNSIALLSNNRKPLIGTDANWLGFFSNREEIRSSLLWNLKHVDENYDPEFLEVLEKAVQRTIKKLIPVAAGKEQ